MDLGASRAENINPFHSNFSVSDGLGGVCRSGGCSGGGGGGGGRGSVRHTWRSGEVARVSQGPGAGARPGAALVRWRHLVRLGRRRARAWRLLLLLRQTDGQKRVITHQTGHLFKVRYHGGRRDGPGQLFEVRDNVRTEGRVRSAV